MRAAQENSPHLSDVYKEFWMLNRRTRVSVCVEAMMTQRLPVVL